MVRLRGARVAIPGLVAAICLLLATLISYLPALGNGYVWDDDAYLTDNQLVLAPDGLRRTWFSLDSPSQYFPLTYTTFRIEHALWGLNPLGYHLVNVLLHGANAVLAWLLLRRLSLPGAWLAAALFALHPVQVESVAWITERKNTLSALFFLAALLAWLRFVEGKEAGKWRGYALALGLCWLALLSKTTAAVLPAVMLILCWLRGERLGRRRMLHVAPFALAGLAMGLLTVWWERSQQGTRGPEFAFDAGERLLIAGRSFWFYLGKLAWPASLTFSYPRWAIDTGDWRQWLWPAGAAILMAALWRGRRRLGRGPFAAFLFFVAVLAPLLGFIALYTFRYSFVADHYQYLACLGPLALFSARLWRRPEQPALHDAGMRVVQSGAILIVCGALTWHQNRIYRDEETLWRDTIAKNPQSWLARTNYGMAALRRGDLDGALEQAAAAVRLKPDSPEAHNNLGYILERRGRLQDALVHYREALRLRPDFPPAKANLGGILAMTGQATEGASQIREAMRNPKVRALTHLRMGDAHAAQGRWEEAAAAYRAALQVAPNFPEASGKLAEVETRLAPRGSTGRR